MRNKDDLYGNGQRSRRVIPETDWKINRREGRLCPIYQGYTLHQADLRAVSSSVSMLNI